MKEIKMEDLVSYCKQYGFIFQGSEIYGGLANTWDYGPLGIRLKNNLIDAWRKRFIQERENSYETSSTILMHPRVWEASGHVESFIDPLIDCRNCKSRYRVDKLIEGFASDVVADKMSEEEQGNFIESNKIPCPNCGSKNFTEIREFNLLFETYRGATSDNKMKIYLRPENAQGQYVNYLNVLRSMRAKLPFSMGQIGTVFRNEITPGNFIFRTIEFEQMEYQTYCKKGEDEKLYDYFKEFGKQFYLDLGISSEKLSYHDHDKLAHYAKAACDIYYEFPWGKDEINGTHNRTDYDLKRHQEYSGISFEYTDLDTKEKYLPYVIESTYGVGRSILALLFNAYKIEKLENGQTREVLAIHPCLAPYKLNVLPLVKRIHGTRAQEIYGALSKNFMCSYDETGSIGKRYRRGDAIGTPFAITIDDETLRDNIVTIRSRDTMEQEKIQVGQLSSYLTEKVKF